MFEYAIKEKITIGKNQSALVPILQSHIDVEKVSLWSASGNDSDDSDEEKSSGALRALWITNSSGLTLDSGSFNILEGDTFAGEGLIDTVHPRDRRLLSYAADTAVQVVAKQESTEKPVSHVRIAKGIMVMTKEERGIFKYTIHNSDTSPRQVVGAESGRDLGFFLSFSRQRGAGKNHRTASRGIPSAGYELPTYQSE